MYTKSSLKTNKHIGKTQQDQWQMLNREYSHQFLTLFQQWELAVQKAEEQEEN